MIERIHEIGIGNCVAIIVAAHTAGFIFTCVIKSARAKAKRRQARRRFYKNRRPVREVTPELVPSSRLRDALMRNRLT